MLLPDPMTRYQHLVDIGILKPDPHQKTIIEKLQRLWDDLKVYDPGPIPPEMPESNRGIVSRTLKIKKGRS